jgi:hypothetical protein
MVERVIIIPLYGPRGLRYAEHPLIVPRLGVPVTEPQELIPPRPEEPAHAELAPAAPLPWAIPPELEEDEEDEEVFWFARGDLRNARPTVISLEGASFSPIEHQGGIVVIESALFLPSATFDIVHEQAAKRGVTVLPIYVRRAQ